MNALRIVFPLALAALLAGLFIGFSSTVLVPGGDSYVDCGVTFAGEASEVGKFRYPHDDWYAVQENCGIARASKMPWAVTLISTGIGLLLSSALLRSANRRPDRPPTP